MKILVTGSSGFIGFHTCLRLLKNTKCSVIGIDNYDNYYSTSLKKARNSILKKNKRFKSIKLDICSKKKINERLKKYKFDAIIHLAAQAGVRYSFINPQKYIDTNIFGFSNIINFGIKNKVKKILYASSSSVYGDSNKFPINEENILLPKNIYGLSKKINEDLAQEIGKIYKIKLIGLRFFTVYGPWGRPDMLIMKYIKSFILNNIFYLNNFGKHERDFTYIDDVTNIIKKLLSFKEKNVEHEVYNICSNRPVNLFNIIKILEKLGVKAKIKKRELQKADVFKTHGNNKKIRKKLGKINYTSIQYGIKKTVDWYKTYGVKSYFLGNYDK